MKRLIASFFCVLMVASTAMAQGQFQEVRGQMIYQQGYILVVGESEAGQSRFKAKRAATVIAQQRMLETVKGLNLVGQTTVQDGMLVSNTIRTDVAGFLQGAQVVGEEYVSGEGYARVALRLNLHGSNSVYSTLAPTILAPPPALKVEPMPQFQPVTAATPAPATPAPAAPAETPAAVPAKPVSYDGLIVIVQGSGFKPALANRIITEKRDILFEPSKVSPQMLIERGCGGYTTTEEKAKALLDSWGSKSPLIVKCVGVQKGTEAVVSVKDATVIFEQNQKTNMLPQAKVVFVL